jgi:hypothetical protein
MSKGPDTFSTDASELFKSRTISWTIEEVLNDHSIYEESIHNIPIEFPTMVDYSTCFEFHLLEEMRVSLRRAIEECDFNSKQIGFSMSDRPFTIILNDLQVKSIQSSFIGLFVHPTAAPTSLSILRDANSFIAYIHMKSREPLRLNEHETEYMCEFSFNEISPAVVDFKSSLWETDTSISWNLFILEVTIIPFLRICDALNAINQHGHRIDDRLKLELLSGRDTDLDHNTGASASTDIVSNTAVNANASQQSAVRRCLHAGLSGSFSAIQIIQGPPGTGKTATLVALLDSLLLNKIRYENRIWVAAPTNEAICELARRAVHDLDSSMTRNEMTLIGDEQRLKLDDSLRAIHLESRVKRVMVAIRLWAESIDSLLNCKFDSLSAEDDLPLQDCGRLSIGHLRHLCDICADQGGLILSECPPRLLASPLFEAMPRALHFISSLAQTLSALSGSTEPDSKLLEACKDAHSRHTIELARLRADRLCRGLRKELMQEHLVMGSRLIFSTVSAAGAPWLQKLKYERGEEFAIDVAIVDEATQLVEAATAIMLSPGLRRLVLAGDHKQLPSTVISRTAQQRRYGVSLFDRLLGAGFRGSFLNVQYRMHPSISRWPNLTFYGGELLDGDNVRGPAYSKAWHKSLPPVSIFDVRGREETGEGGSKFNLVEVAVALRLLQTFLHSPGLKDEFAAAAAPDRKVRIGLLTPYSAQREALEQHLRGRRLNEGRCCVRVSTVDGFQGQECDIIIFLTVRSNEKRSLGFLKDFRRLNVAMTRAKFSLVVIGDSATLKSDQTWSSFIESVASNGQIFTAANHGGLRSAVSNFSDELISSFDFGGSIWENKIRVASSFKNSLQKRWDLPVQRRRIFSALCSIADGKWPRRSRAEPQCHGPAYDGVRSGNIIFVSSFGAANIVFSVDLACHISEHSVKLRDYEQIIMIWDCVTSDQVARTVQRVRSRYERRSSRWLELCSHYCTESRLRLPQCWRGIEPFNHDADMQMHLAGSHVAGAPRATEEVRDSLALTKSYALNTLHLRILLNCGSSQHVELVHSVSAEEEYLIGFSRSLFVIGRSGTGDDLMM